MLRAAGALLLIFFAAYSALLYTKEGERRLSECEGALLFVRHLGFQIAEYRTPLSGAIASFENRALQACGFLPMAKEAGIAAALAGSRILLGEEAKGLLLRLAERTNTQSVREATAACAEAEEGLAHLFAKEKCEGPARVKAGRALILFFALTALLVLG